MVLFDHSIINITDIASVNETTSAVKHLSIIWLIIVIILGTVGNGAVLIGSLKYRALEMDRISIFLLECIAVADMTQALLVFVPSLITVIANRWLLGGGFCVFEAIARVVVPGAEVMLITVTALYRVYLIVRPFAIIPEITSYRKACFVALVILPVSIDRLLTFLTGNKAYLNPYHYTCSAKGKAELWTLISVFINILIPAGVICSCSVFLIYKAAKLLAAHSKRIKSKGTCTIVLLMAAFILSYIPWTVAEFVARANDDKRGGIDVLTPMFFGVNVIVNPFIYTLTNNRFCFFMNTLIGSQRVNPLVNGNTMSRSQNLNLDRTMSSTARNRSELISMSWVTDLESGQRKVVEVKSASVTPDLSGGTPGSRRRFQK